MSHLHQLQSEVFKWLNKARREPLQFVEVLTTYLVHVKSNVYTNPVTGMKLQLKEGLAGIKECIQYLRTLKPLEPLQLNEQLNEAAKTHSEDIGLSGETGHESSTGLGLVERLNQCVPSSNLVGENICVLESDGLSIMLDWLIDDGNPERTQRKNVFNPK